MPAASQLLDRFSRRDRRALAEILTLAEAGTAPKLPATHQQSPARVVGITGSGGAGKSTLVAALISHLRESGFSVAVLACDPQSPVTGGALLGDRIRIRFDPADEKVFFRSLSTRGAAGGISAATRAARDWLQAFGFDVILIETVGVGQDQVAVREIVDTLVLLVTPNTGDEVQWEKAGLIEVADIVVVNKSDLPGADRARQQLVSALSLGPVANRAPVLNVTASTGRGVVELWQAIAERPLGEVHS
jgi:LAO/AO transport system kinase